MGYNKYIVTKEDRLPVFQLIEDKYVDEEYDYYADMARKKLPALGVVESIKSLSTNKVYNVYTFVQ
jgi:hypothetical protein